MGERTVKLQCVSISLYFLSSRAYKDIAEVLCSTLQS